MRRSSASRLPANPLLRSGYRARWRYLPRLLALLWEADRRGVLVVVLLSALSGLLPLLSVALLQRLVDSALAAIQQQAGWPAVALWGGALLAANGLAALGATAQHWLGDDIHERLKARVQQRVLAATGRLSLADFETPQLYDQLQRAQRGIDTRLLTTLQQLVPVPATVVTLLSLYLYLATAHPLLPLLLAAGLVPLVWRSTRYFAHRYMLEQRYGPAERRERYLAGLLTELPAAAEVRLFGLRGYLLEAWREQYMSLRGARLELARGDAMLLVGRSVLEQLLIGVALAGVVALIIAGRVSLGFFASFISAVSQFTGALYNLLWSVAGTDSDLRYIGDVLDYLDRGRPSEHGTTARPLLRPAVRFEGVSFTYPGMEQPSLEAIDLTLAAGERIALVGANGSGKTTLAKLLLGLYEPSVGRISLDGVDLASCDRSWWHRHTAAVFQDYVRYELTARDNIGIGDVTRNGEPGAIERAAERSGADRFIAALPDGYATMLGKAYDEAGVELSGGQWQSLAIARAYFRDAPIVVLDEPAAALDARAEWELYQQFLRLASNKTVLLISHRLGSARLADRIVVLDQGKIVEQGTHAALLRAGGVYAAMYEAQAQWYR